MPIEFSDWWTPEDDMALERQELFDAGYYDDDNDPGPSPGITPDDECPAGGTHRYEYLTAWDQAVDDHDHRWHSGYFCVECGHEATVAA